MYEKKNTTYWHFLFLFLLQFAWEADTFSLCSEIEMQNYDDLLNLTKMSLFFFFKVWYRGCNFNHGLPLCQQSNIMIFLKYITWIVLLLFCNKTDKVSLEEKGFKIESGHVKKEPIAVHTLDILSFTVCVWNSTDFPPRNRPNF